MPLVLAVDFYGISRSLTQRRTAAVTLLERVADSATKNADAGRTTRHIA